MDDPATDGFDTGFDFGTGFGLIQAEAALGASLQPPPAPPPPPVACVPPPAIPPPGKPISPCNGSTCGVRLNCPDTTTACISQIDITVRASAVRLGSGPGASATAARRRIFAAGVANIPPGQTITVPVQVTKSGRKIRTRLLNRNVTRIRSRDGRLEVRNISGAGVSNIPTTIRLIRRRPR